MLKITQKVISGKKRGRKIGFPTLNFPLEKNEKIKRGVWVVKLKSGKKEYFGIANVGSAKTFNEKEEKIEVHVFSPLKNEIKKAKIYFLKYLRKTKKFKKVENLKKQIKKDIKEALSFLDSFKKSLTKIGLDKKRQNK